MQYEESDTSLALINNIEVESNLFTEAWECGKLSHLIVAISGTRGWEAW
ncbi:hypothetical protein [Nitrosospira sp. Nsp1]|nr:hypothetical protein [Nitrosospira sp. Nsp1]